MRAQMTVQKVTSFCSNGFWSDLACVLATPLGERVSRTRQTNRFKQVLPITKIKGQSLPRRAWLSRYYMITSIGPGSGMASSAPS